MPELRQGTLSACAGARGAVSQPQKAARFSSMGLRRIVLVVMLGAIMLAPSPAFANTAAVDGEKVLALIRKEFRSHPRPPYVSYTLKRAQFTEEGFPDFEWSYTYHVWCRTSDGAALARKVWRGHAGPLEFKKYAFNQPEDPGPPTADIFEAAPSRTPVQTVVTGGLPEIGTVRAIGETEYRVSLSGFDEGVMHLSLKPMYDPQRNRLREIFAEASSYRLRQVVGTDRLYLLGGPVFDQLDTMTMGNVDGVPVITAIHAVVQNERVGYLESDYTFTDIAFPRALPNWYFEPTTYGAHVAEAPS